MLPHMTWAFACLLLALALGTCATEGDSDLQPRASGPPARPDVDLEDEAPGQDPPAVHQLRKRFIWTLTQEPYFYGKYEHNEHEGSRGTPESGPEALPQPLGLRNPTSLHKRLYPRWYHAYVYKTPSFNRMASPIGGTKRFQPLHPLARFRGLAMGSSPGYSAGYHIPADLPLSDQPGHPVPSAPNAQPSDEDELEEEEIDAEGKIKAGELLQFLKNLATDRGLSSHTKSFRYGISKRK